MSAFEATLARDASATRALENWCDARHIANPARVTAERLPMTTGTTPRFVRRALGLKPQQLIGSRKVRLSCGAIPLSIAWNWYDPARLTPAMRAALQDTDTPFGKVVAPLGFRRLALATQAGRVSPCPARTISTHRARLDLPGGTPLAYVIECYTAANLKAGQTLAE
ncbi:hypothetical protein GGR39_002320 [Novosphingobium fluoreni]|uniref:Chorismate lyase n=1 Tax=Novosphingobium fluoreni TaxID=1391222 RepID=A0A7W6C4G2_9SPHN|nr:hypothetical protein [Novosphingobium fluoreni]MBB3940663.1 hypothetical protein [Novosphingobium fluoreni]